MQEQQATTRRTRVVSTKLDIKYKWIACVVCVDMDAYMCVRMWDAKNEKLHAVAVADADATLIEVACLPVSPVRVYVFVQITNNAHHFSFPQCSVSSCLG